MKGFLLALQFLTRIPVSVKGEVTNRKLGASFAWYPVVGALLGGLSGAAAWLVSLAAGSPFLPAAAAMLVMLFLTGGFHIDGLGDTADGLYAGRGDPQRTLAVMKDSRVGAMAVMAIVADLILRCLCLTEGGMAGPSVIKLYVAAAVCGRTAVTAAAAWTKPATDSGLSGALLAHVGNLQMVIAALVCVLVCVGCCGLWLGLTATGLTLLGSGVAVLVFKRKLGGMTGDLLGMLNEAVEVGMLLIIPFVYGLI